MVRAFLEGFGYSLYVFNLESGLIPATLSQQSTGQLPLDGNLLAIKGPIPVGLH
jgi:hypothetical protein